MDANGAEKSPQQIKYRRYDSAGRLAEVGISPFNLDRARLEALAEVPTAPGNIAGWHTRYLYGAVDAVDNSANRLAEVQTRCDGEHYDSQRFVYDAQGQVIEVVETLQPGAIDWHTKYRYSDSGALVAITYPQPWPDASTLTVTYAYDAQGRLSKVGRILNDRATDDYYARYQYDEQGYLSNEFLNNSAAATAQLLTDFSHDGAGRLRSIATGMSGITLYLQSLHYPDETSPKPGAMEQVFNLDGSGAQTLNFKFSYGPRNQLQGVSATGTVPNAASFSYGITDEDERGNLLGSWSGDSLSKNGANAVRTMRYAYAPDSDRLTSLTVSGNGVVANSQQFSYDADGNVTAVSDHLARLAYEPFTNLVSEIVPDQARGQLVAQRYAGLGRRRSTMTVFDNDHIIEQGNYAHGAGSMPLLIVRSPASDAAAGAAGKPAVASRSRKLMIYGLSGLIAVNDDSNEDGATDYFLVKDYQRSTIAVVRQDGMVNDSYRYTPTGAVMDEEGEPVHTSQMVPYLFRGQEYDWQSGLHYIHGRLYDSTTLRFLSPDYLALPNAARSAYLGSQVGLTKDRDPAIEADATCATPPSRQALRGLLCMPVVK
jgi:RHS repeat-associated protein